MELQLHMEAQSKKYMIGWALKLLIVKTMKSKTSMFLLLIQKDFMDQKKKNQYANLILLLLFISSKIITISSPQPDDSICDFLSICKLFMELNDNVNSEDPFENKLIVRLKDYPDVNKKDVDYYTSLFENKSYLVKIFKDQSINPIFIPGGPFDIAEQKHDPKFTKKFLDTIFDSFLNPKSINNIFYSDPKQFVENTLQNIDDHIISNFFKEKSAIEKILEI